MWVEVLARFASAAGDSHNPLDTTNVVNTVLPRTTVPMTGLTKCQYFRDNE